MLSNKLNHIRPGFYCQEQGLALLSSCKDLQFFLDDKRRPFWDVCHYTLLLAFINIGSMFREEYSRFSIFADLDSNQISQLTPFMVECRFKNECVIFEQGQPAEYLYILLSGEVVIKYKPYDGPPLNVAHIGPGGVFGWSAALQRDLYTSGAVALKESLTYRIRGSNLHVLRAQSPETAEILFDRLAGVIAERLRGTHNQVLGILTENNASKKHV